ncbi:MAG TPA: ribonuclease PH [Nitrolancea sp.]|nr:ribonuclease PH [Nitrolancea sp.]
MASTYNRKRPDGRANDALRPLEIIPGFAPYADGSALIKCGDTHVLCTATIEDKVPPFLTGKGRGWVTAEYGMLPRSSPQRIPRERSLESGRTKEIQRMIGRSLRAVVDLRSLGERTILIDCDVIQADGGTRTASITGGFVALHDALSWLRERGLIVTLPITDFIAAVSVGVYRGTPVLDLDYAEDSQCDTDMNLVMTAGGRYIEVQGTAEGAPYSRAEMSAMLDLGEKGIRQLAAAQKNALGLA